MKSQAAARNIRRSFTLTPEALAFVRETRNRRGVSSDSKAVDLLLHEAMLRAKQQEIDAAYKEYYDTASDEDLAEQREWAEGAGRNTWIGVPEV